MSKLTILSYSTDCSLIIKVSLNGLVIALCKFASSKGFVFCVQSVGLVAKGNSKECVWVLLSRCW